MRTRREFGMLTGGGIVAAAAPQELWADRRRRVAIMAPSNLGLRPLRLGHVPGAWRAPEALEAAGLVTAIGSGTVVRLERPAYNTEASPGPRIRNGPAIRRFNERLAEAVADALSAGRFPIVIGGDCSILLGCLAGARGSEPIGLVHVDGHSDFYHPGNYDSLTRLGSAAGMDLALVTGRGEPLLADWDGAPLVRDELVSQIGDRDELDPDYDYRDIEATRIRRFPVRAVKRSGLAAVVSSVLAPVGTRARPVASCRCRRLGRWAHARRGLARFTGIHLCGTGRASGAAAGVRPDHRPGRRHLRPRPGSGRATCPADR